MCDKYPNCEGCEYRAKLGVHGFCVKASCVSGRVAFWDCAVLDIKSDYDRNVRCLNCDRHLNPNTVRCEECLKTPELKNFKEWKPGRAIYE